MNFDLQKKEACRRLRLLEKELNLNSLIREAFEAGELLCSVNVPGPALSKIRKVADDNRISRIVARFEENCDSMVYHCLDQGSRIAMLYVGPKPEGWTRPVVVGDAAIIFAAVYDIRSKCTEFGDMVFLRLYGALAKVG